MVSVRKFSEFPPGTLDEAVGLTAGANTRGPSGGGGSGSVTHTFPQQLPPVTKGTWLRVEPGSGDYVDAQGDTVEHGEVIGLCTEADATTFTVTQAGYIESGLAIPGITGLTPGSAYFIDTASGGVMVPTDASVNGQVSRPVFLADSADSGWVLPYRGLIVGGAAPSSSGATTDSNIHVVNQTAHGFIPGDALRTNTVTPGGPVQYTKAIGNSLANSQVVGIVCADPAPTANQFSLQECGYNEGSITQDFMLNPVVANTIYYLSPTVAGKVTSVNPTGVGEYSRPVYICEQGTATLGANAGWILPQRPLNSFSGNPAASPYIFMGNLTNTSPDGPYADANIFNSNGGPYRTYLIVFNPNVINGHGLSATGPNPINIGFQFAHNGVFHVGTDCQATLSGVNNSAGAVVPTPWGFIDDTSGGETIATIFPTIPGETGTRVAMSSYEATLTDNGFGRGMTILGMGYFTDWSVGNVPSNHNFTSMGFSAAGNGGAGAADYTSGLRLVFQGVGAAIFDGTQGYFSIWALPNS